jgi:hypothetical protein
MKRALLLVLLAASVPLSAQDPARALVQKAIDAQGGEAALEAVTVVAVETMGHGYALEQSERPEGPYLVSYQQVSEIRDHARERHWRKLEQRNWSSANWNGPTMAVADGVAALSFGGRWRPHQPQQIARSKEEMALSPERLLLTALAAPDLRRAPDRTLHGIVNHAVAFTYNDFALTLYLNSHSGLPTMLQSVGDDMFGIWGDVTRESWYTFWALQPGGWQFPMQITTTWNGLPYTDTTTMTLKVNEPADEALFAIPDDAKAAFQKMAALPAAPAGMRSVRLDASKAIALADNVVVLPGSWAVALVRQPDGIVVLEAPIGSAYSAQVIDAAAAKFPGVPIKAVVTTSDAWPHLGGVREYVARGIPVYALDLNTPILKRLVQATYTTAPDALATTPRAPIWKVVSERTTIGEGATRVDVIPVRGEGSERMMIAYLPGLNLLYASDLLQYNRDRTTFFNPVYPAETAAAVQREDITGLQQVWAMHMNPIPWSKVTDALAAIRAK